MNDNHNDTWEEWSKYILNELVSLNKRTDDINKQLTQIHVELATLKVKSGIWGAIAGFIPAVIASIYFLIKH